MDLFERITQNSALRTAFSLRRKLRGPKRPSWTLEMEISAEFMRLYGPVLMRLSADSQRRGAEALLKPTRLARDMRRTPVKLGDVPGEWFHPDNQDHEGVLLYLHGGGYVLGSLHTHQNLIAGLAQAAGCRALGIEYRLAPEHPFPAAVEDSTQTYRWLLEQGISPTRIVIAGDSAGGGLTLATLLKLRELGLPQPAAAVAISPWVDMEGTGASLLAHETVDYIVKPYLELCRGWLVKHHDARHPMLSPIYADLTGIAPLMIQVGGAEGLLDDSFRLAAKARDHGVEVELDVHPDMVHVWHIFASFSPEARRAIRMVGEYIRRKTASAPVLAVAEE